jgi:hypothetical protein
MENFNRWIQAFLAIVVTFGFFGVIAWLMYAGKIDPGVKDILLVLLGALLASYKEITGYFFGSSSGSAKKDEVINAQAATVTAQAATASALATSAGAGSGLTGATPTGTVDDPVAVKEVKP